MIPANGPLRVAVVMGHASYRFPPRSEHGGRSDETVSVSLIADAIRLRRRRRRKILPPSCGDSLKESHRPTLSGLFQAQLTFRLVGLHRIGFVLQFKLGTVRINLNVVILIVRARERLPCHVDLTSSGKRCSD